MKQSTILTESEQDQLLLQALLDVRSDDANVRVMAAGSLLGVASLARSLLRRVETMVLNIICSLGQDGELK